MYLFFTDTLSVCFEVYIRITLNITHLLTNVVDPKSLDERPFDEFFQVLKQNVMLMCSEQKCC